MGFGGRIYKKRWDTNPLFTLTVQNLEVASAMKKHIEVVRQALEEHLASINENSSEIAALFDYLHQVESKIDKLCQRLDEVQLTSCNERIEIASLNHVEKEVFLLLYTSQQPLTFAEIAARVDIPKALAPECVSALVQKGVPLKRTYASDQLFFTLDPQFKELQAKENIVNLSLQSFMK